jgi:hypothetical protein
MKLDKQQSRQRWQEIRNLWCEWDPIGVLSEPGWAQDEYDHYLGPCLRFLEQKAGVEKLTAYLCTIVGNYMGLGQPGLDYANPQDFACKLQQWYSDKWPDTHV